MAGPPRTDLRQYEELRPLTVEFDVAPEATASVIVACGLTKVSVSVYGPSQPRYLRHEEYDKCTLEVEYRANYNASTTCRNLLENDGMVMVKKIMEPALMLNQFPRMMILIKVNILQDGGSLNAVVLNACTLALCKSGIPMSYMPVSVRCVRTAAGGFLLDPVTSEETSASSTESTYDFSFNTSGASPKLLSTACSGCFSVEDMKTGLEICNAASVNVDRAIKGYIMRSMQGNMCA